MAGRQAERAALDQLVEALRAGQSRSLVIHGEVGIGKTALLDYLAARAADMRIVRAAGVESEMELAYAGLHQICAPFLDRLDRLPAPQRESMQVAFGISSGPAPDQFVFGLGLLGLLSHAAEEKPLLCIVDDQQWLDCASAKALAFVARRLGEESVGMVFATRERRIEVVGLPDLPVAELPEADARRLLDSALRGPLDARVRDQIVAETHGNPLALLELPRGASAAELAGGFVLPRADSLTGALEESFRRRYSALTSGARRLLLIAAADPTGDAALVWRAAARMGIGHDTAVEAADAGLAEIGTHVRFRHPLVRSATYWSASAADRQSVHRAIGEETDPVRDPDRRIWHFAEAAAGPDPDLADDLERSASQALGRGGLAAAAAFLERSALLTLDPARRGERALAAAEVKVQAGRFDAAVALLATAEGGPLDERQRARIDLLRAQLAFAASRGGEASLLLLRAARRFEPIDSDRARETYLDGISAAAFAGRLASAGGGVLDLSRAAAAAPAPPQAPRAIDHLLDGLAANFVEGYPPAVPSLRDALAKFPGAMSTTDELRWMWLANEAALHLWDDERWNALSARYLQLARDVGALTELPLALSTRAIMLVFTGELSGATALIEEQAAATEATGINLGPYAAAYLAAMRGRRAESTALTEGILAEVPRRGEGIGIAIAEWTRALLHNGAGDYPEAMAAAQRALHHQEYPELHYPGIANWAAHELIEAAARSEMTDTATEATEWITEMATASGTDWALGVGARSRALLAQGSDAERLYREAIARLEASLIRTDLARAHLLYGEWLRRERRRVDAREQLRTAHQMLESMGMSAFADRARRELLATGETARKRSAPTVTAELTAQEAQIARLARDGLSNPEIGTRLFISAKTVQYHLRKVFTKLGITSRGQLAYVQF
ncbi:AAA family ATPase [Mycolicibacterium sp. 050232]|uniref:helix-turn-helix transcriptional regulator n=1 Tax=Mycolicibacterium sp. 050232 TaxID=3113982 RepID=UPI002E2A9593|nr:AAA family ATPase [Mycolicibacterium sp. 050232]MED5812208.1 AAA family ATPase [Mycolicibacterium sp. 050232]